MRFSNPNFQHFAFLLIFFASLSSSSSNYYLWHLCGPASNSSNIRDNFKNLTAGLSAIVNSQKWEIFSITNPPPKLYGLAQCYGHISSEECHACFASASEQLRLCLPAESGRVFLDGCFHRYDSREFYYDIFGLYSDNVTSGSPTAALIDLYIVYDFESKLNKAVSNVTEKAVANDGFGTTEVKGGALTVYPLVQCWKTIDAEHCKQCLNSAETRLHYTDEFKVNCHRDVGGKLDLWMESRPLLGIRDEDEPPLLSIGKKEGRRMRRNREGGEDGR